jgi:hypothetical protein
MSMIEKVALVEAAFAIRENVQPSLDELKINVHAERVSFFRDLHEYIDNVDEHEDESVTLNLEDRLGDFLNYRACKMIDDARDAD